MSFWIWTLLLALIASCAFSAGETAFISSNRLRQRRESERNRLGARTAERLYRRPERTISVLLIGVNLAAVLSSISAMTITENTLAAMNLNISEIATDILSTLWVTMLILTLAEILPKSVASLYSDRLTRLASFLLYPLSVLLGPLVWALNQISRLVAKRFSDHPLRGEESFSWETVNMHVKTGRETGTMTASEEALIRRIAILNRFTARTLMTPLAELPLFPADDSAESLTRQVRQSPVPRTFLHDSSGSRLTGAIPTGRLLNCKPSQSAGQLQTPLRAVPAARPLLDLIDELQFTRSKMALVEDLDGSSLGVVFLSSLLAKLVELRPEPSSEA